MRNGEPGLRGLKRRYDMMLGFALAGRDRDPVTERLGRSRDNKPGNSASSPAREQRSIATPPNCTCTKAIDNDATDRIAGDRRACTRVSLLTKMRDVNSVADETISLRPRADGGDTHGVSSAMY